MMVNIPTELLRTLVSVIDLRSFTKAAQALGVTQPAVSAQIKRLQMLLGSEILDKSAPGVTLTPTGEMIVNHARRLLSINDQILGLATPRPRSQTIRIGVPGDFVSPHLPWTLAEFRNRWPETMFSVRTGHSDALLDDFQQGNARSHDPAVGRAVARCAPPMVGGDGLDPRPAAFLSASTTGFRWSRSERIVFSIASPSKRCRNADACMKRSIRAPARPVLPPPSALGLA